MFYFLICTRTKHQVLERISFYLVKWRSLIKKKHFAAIITQNCVKKLFELYLNNVKIEAKTLGKYS